MVKSLKNNEKAEEGIMSWVYLIIVLFLIIGAVSFWVYGAYKDTQHNTVYEKVTKAERVVDKDGKHARYVVWGVNDTLGTSETFEITDSYINGRLNSSDLYGKIIIGHTYKFDVVGYRWDVTSNYRNILSAEDTTTFT